MEFHMDIQRKNLADFTFKQTYAKYIAPKKRRENWGEAVSRMMDMHATKLIDKIEVYEDLNEIEDAIVNKDILGSQRALQFGGRAILEKNWRIFNCTTSYCDRPRFFAEALWLLLCGCGVGYSIQKHHVKKLPPVISANAVNSAKMQVHLVKDTIEGWADALNALIEFYLGLSDTMPIFNFSQVRKRGSSLSHGGKAPGPIPLKMSLQKIEAVLFSCAGRSLRPIDCNDIICHAADCVLSGGVRRSATIALFSMDDEEMWKSKTGNWWATNPQRARANISAVFIKNTVDKETFKKKFLEYVPQWGEPGIIFAESTEFCFNPCVEIAMCPVLIKDENGDVVTEYDQDLLNFDKREKYESKGFTFESGWQACNLTEVNASKFKAFDTDNIDYMYNAVKQATKLGTIQASYTKADYLGEVSQMIVEREALLGVSLTGLANSAFFHSDKRQEAYDLLKDLAQFACKVNKDFAEKIGINPASRITCVKPSGTASVVLGCASGIHPEHAQRFIRSVQVPADSLLVQKYMEINPFAVVDSVWSANKTDKCIQFAVECDQDDLFKNDVNAIDFLSLVKMVFESWVKNGNANPSSLYKANHNVSNTCIVRPTEWGDLSDYIFDNQDFFCGISFIGASGDYDYMQPPFKAVYSLEERSKMYATALYEAEKKAGNQEELDAIIKQLDQRNKEYIEAFDLFMKLRESNQIDFDSVIEDDDQTEQAKEVACAGGACLI